jgi:hypothetical protein
LKLPETLHSRLEALARQQGTSKSAVIREALEESLAGNGARPPVSCLDLVRDLVGCVQGPGDLSVNKRYLEDFGK